MDAAIKELKDNVCIKAVKGLYRGRERVDMDAGYRSEVKVCLERARLITQSYRESEGEPMITRRARALKKILENMTIYIQDRERLVGNMASDTYSLPLYPELYWRWLEKALDNEYQHLLDDAGKKELKEINKYWTKLSVHGMERSLVPGSLKPYTGYGPVSVFSYTWDMVLPNYEKIFKLGLRGIIQQAQDRLKEIEADLTLEAGDYLEQKRFLEAAIISLEATIAFAKRYAALAREKAGTEKRPDEKKRLEKLAGICENVPENPSRTMHEAIQCFFFIHLITGFIELPSVGCGVRLDQVLYPYYKKDLDEGRLTREEALNLIESIWIKFEEMGFIHPPRLFGSAGGGLAWQNVTLGGLDKEGKDASNELSYLILEATRELHSVQPPLCFRYNDKTPRALVLKAIDTIRSGVAQPAFFNDKMMIPYLLEKGIPLEDARDYAISNCMSWIIPGKSMVYRQGMGMFSFTNCMMLALNKGTDWLSGQKVGAFTPDPLAFKSIDDIIEATFQQFNFFMGTQVYISNIADALYQEYLPRPLISALVDDLIERGKDCRQHYYFHRNYMMPTGVNNVVDSLSAIKKLVFEDKKITMSELLDALKQNFEGKEELRQMLLGAPKFGNDDDYVDSIAEKVHFRIKEETQKYTTYYGYPYDTDGTNASVGYFLGFDVAATPEGRKAREPLHDGTVSPVQGRDRKGPSAVLKSVGKVDPLLSCNHLFNQRFAPHFLEGENREVFSDYLKTWSDLGIHHIQFNVIDLKVLKEAQAHPEKHADLIVRVAGYSAYFVDLTKTLQDDIIDTMCRAGYAGIVTEDEWKEVWSFYESRACVKGTFGGVLKKLGVSEQDGWKVVASQYKPSLDAMIKEMDEIGVEKAFVDQQLIWSRREGKLATAFPVERIADLVQRGKGRIVGGAGYNPLRIEESLKDLEKAVKEYGFKYVWFHPNSFGFKASDAKCYPLYAKCIELGIPVTFQTGHSAEPLPSEIGRPMYADEVAMDFPNLVMVLTHTGWPWIDEWVSMIWRHPNVYGNIGAYMPSGLHKPTIDFMDGPMGRTKVFWATNGFGLTRCKKEFVELPIKDDNKKRILRDNAVSIFKL